MEGVILGNYIDTNTLISRMGNTQVTQLCVPRTGTDLTDYLNEVIDRAEAQIDDCADVRWVTPLPKSAFIAEWAYTLCTYELMKAGPGGEVPVKFEKDHELTMKMLMEMSYGKYEPRGATKLEVSNVIGHSVDVMGDPPQFAYNQTKHW
jgi:phage gp36-like protein